MALLNTAKRHSTLWKIFTRKFSVRELYRVGDEVTVVKKITQKDLDDFSRLTGDTNPIHSIEVSEEKRLVHGAFLNAIVSGVIGTRLPGAGTVVLSQKMSYPQKCRANREIEIFVKLIENRKIMKLAYECRQDGEIVFKGDARVMCRSIY